MDTFEGLTFQRLTKEDVPVLTDIMTRAFNEDSRLFFQNPVGGPPGYDDGSFIQKWGLESGAHSYRVDKDGKTIGSIMLFVDEKKAKGILGTIFVDPDIAGKGYGHTIWRFAEHKYPMIREWNTETPAVSYRNHCFYVNKCGFKVIHVDGKRGDRYEAQFILQKKLDEQA